MRSTIGFYLGEVKLPVKKCKRPSFKSHRGRTWDSGRIFIDGVECVVYLDTTWGNSIYFQYGDNMQWHSLKMWSELEADFNGKQYDVDPFQNPKPQITTK